jgi:hypothetical protein
MMEIFVPLLQTFIYSSGVYELTSPHKTFYMKTLLNLLCLVLLFFFITCKKQDNSVLVPPTVNNGNNNAPVNTDNYLSTGDFLSKNAVLSQLFSVNAASGGSFTTAQGTVVTIPPNEFVTKTRGAVSGSVSIEFKDLIYKSDMLLNDKSTVANGTQLLKSGGEFFIKATANGNTVVPNGSFPGISVQLPLIGGAVDPKMQAFVLANDSGTQFNPNQLGANTWVQNQNQNITQDSGGSSVSGYVFSLYQYSGNPDSGSWCNSDNSSYFSAYTQTGLNIQETDTASNYGTYVFLLFKNIDCMVHVYNEGANSFPYNYAPQGLVCTVVAMGVKGGKLYSSFTPILIGSDKVVNFSLTQTTTAAFMKELKALN